MHGSYVRTTSVQNKVCLSHVLGRMCAGIAGRSGSDRPQCSLKSRAKSRPMATCDDGCRNREFELE